MISVSEFSDFDDDQSFINAVTNDIKEVFFIPQCYFIPNYCGCIDNLCTILVWTKADR